MRVRSQEAASATSEAAERLTSDTADNMPTDSVKPAATAEAGDSQATKSQGGCLQGMVSSHVPFQILIPPIAPGQETLKKTIMVEVVGDDEIITPDSMQTLDIIKMQMMIKRLNETVRQLTGMNPCQPT